MPRFATFLNQSMSADCLFRLAQRWFMWRMDSVGLLIIITTAVVVVATKVTQGYCFLSNVRTTL